MEPYELKRMFERMSPSPEQEAAVLDRMLREERKERPMRRVKKWTVFPAAAALLLATITCAAANVTGLDQRLLDFFGGREEAETVLLPGAMTLDLAVESGGAELRVTQVLRDRYTIALAADFTAPEGTVLDTSDPDLTFCGFLPGEEDTAFFDETGRSVGEDYSYSAKWICLEDGEARDNHLSLLYLLHVTDGLREDRLPASFRLSAGDLEFFRRSTVDTEALWAGDWSMEIPLPGNILGESQSFDQAAGELDGSAIRLREVYLSPVTMMVTLERDRGNPGESGSEAWVRASHRWHFALDGVRFAAENGYEPVVERVVLKDPKGREIPLEYQDTGSDVEAALGEGRMRNHYVFRLLEAVDPAELRGGTLTLRIGEACCEVPLDRLCPAEE